MPQLVGKSVTSYGGVSETQELQFDDVSTVKLNDDQSDRSPHSAVGMSRFSKNSKNFSDLIQNTSLDAQQIENFFQDEKLHKILIIE